MESQFSFTLAAPPTPTAPSDPTGQSILMNDLLRQILEVQREQLGQMKATAAAQDAGARWRTLLSRWREEYPNLPEGCKQALPMLEKAYGAMVHQMIEELHEKEESLDNEFTLADFLDRYGMKVGQLGNILNVVGPLADAANALQQQQQQNEQQ